MDNVFQSFEECMEKLKEYYNSTFVYHYYNKHYSQTGGVYSDIKKALDHAREDRMISSKEYKSIQKEIEEDGDYEVFQFSIEKIKLYYPKTENISSFKRMIYILRYPNVAFISEEKAYEVGFKYVVSRDERENINTCDRYMWGRKQDFENRTRTECNKMWIKEVLDDYSFLHGKKAKIFFDYIFGKIDSISYEKLDDEYGYVWEKLWEARIEGDQFSCKNHIEEVDRYRVEI
jgi:hypothetical protein